MKSNLAEWLEKYARKILWLIILITFLLGVVYSLYLGDTMRFFDEKEYYTIAQNLVEKGFFTINGSDPSAWRPPGFPLWLSLFLWVGGNIFVLRLANFMLLCVCVFLVYKILEKNSKLAGIIGVILFSFFPLFFFTASTLYPQIFTTALFLLTIYLLYREREVSYLTVIFVGAIYGILTLTVVTFIGSLFITALWLVFEQWKMWKKSLVMILTAILVLAPWSIRNYLVFDTFVFGSTNGGIVFVLGNSPLTEPNVGGNISLPVLAKDDKWNEIQINNYYNSVAWDYIKTHKWQSIKMYFLKFLNYFNFRNILMTKSEESYFRDAVLFLTYYTLLVIALIRIMLWKYIKLSSQEIYLILLYIGHGLLLALFITRIRYRLPYDPILPLLGAPLIVHLLKNRRSIVRES